jgi:hypothetical protein
MFLDEDSGFFSEDLLLFKKEKTMIIVTIPAKIAINIGCPAGLSPDAVSAMTTTNNQPINRYTLSS